LHSNLHDDDFRISFFDPSHGRWAAGYGHALTLDGTLESNRLIDYNDYLDHIMRGATVGTDTWTVAEAKAKFSEVIDRAQSNGPQIVTRSGRKSVVVVSAEEWERKTKRVGNLAEFFGSSPLRGSGLRVKRSKDGPRKVDL
jgi:prevent-host-death family protein